MSLSHVKFQGDYLDDIAALLEDLHTVWTQFELVTDKELLGPGKELFAATIAVALPDLSEESTAHFRGEYHRKHLALVNALRAMNGVESIEREIADPPTRTAARAKYGEYIRVAAEVMYEKARTNPPTGKKP
jgi:head-tail adaptor